MRSGSRFLIFGGSGQLGTALRRELVGCDAVVGAPPRSEVDLLRDEPALVIRHHAPTVVINAAAYNDVGGAELAANRIAAFRLNRDAPREMARCCSSLGIPFVQVSTDYVFDGQAQRPYREDDAVAPLQVYGLTKLEGEQAVLGNWSRALVVRTSTLFGATGRRGANYVDAVLDQAGASAEIEVVRHPISSPTSASDLASALLALVAVEARGLVHVVNSGSCSRLQLAVEALRLAGLAVTVRERPARADAVPRPAYSVLDCSRYAQVTGRSLRPWSEALGDHIRARPRG